MLATEDQFKEVFSYVNQKKKRLHQGPGLKHAVENDHML